MGACQYIYAGYWYVQPCCLNGWILFTHSVNSTASECELQRDVDVLLFSATQCCPNIDVCFFLKRCLSLLFNRKSATSAKRCRCLTENSGCADGATDENQTRAGACWLCQVFNIVNRKLSCIYFLLLLCVPRNLHLLFAPRPRSRFLAPAWMQEWEALLGDRLAPSFQEAECRTSTVRG